MTHKLLFDTNPIVILPELAVKVGLNEAVFLQQIHYWVEQNKRMHKNYRDGYYWTYNTFNEWQKQFPWWSVRTIKTTISKLENSGLVMSGNYNKVAFDRTKWYRIDYSKLSEIINELPLCNICTMDSVKTAPPIPETITDIKYNNITKAQSKELSVGNFLYDESNNIFKTVTDDYGEERVKYVLDAVNWYIDKAYPARTGRSHPKENKAKRMTFVLKVLQCADTTMLDDKDIVTALERAINNYKNCDPTIYWVTTPTVLGYWLIQDENIGYESVNQSEYAPVESVY